jgi:hypothetical protein
VAERNPDKTGAARRRTAWAKQLHHPLPKWHRPQAVTNDGDPVNACGPFAAAIVANALYDADVVDPIALARRLEGPPTERGTWLPARVRDWATFPWGVVRALRQMGLRARWRLFASPDRLRRNLDRGITTIALIGEPLRWRNRRYAGWSHYLIVYAWDPDAGWAFVDSHAPGGSVYTYRDDATFRRLWRNMARQLIEVERP